MNTFSLHLVFFLHLIQMPLIMLPFLKGLSLHNGGRLSSVVDVTMKEVNYKKYALNGSVGLVASRLTIEGPVIKHKAT